MAFTIIEVKRGGAGRGPCEGVNVSVKGGKATVRIGVELAKPLGARVTVGRDGNKLLISPAAKGVKHSRSLVTLSGSSTPTVRVPLVYKDGKYPGCKTHSDKSGLIVELP